MTGLRKTITLLPGDGIGPEVISAAQKILECAGEFGHRFETFELPIGGVAIDRCGSPLPAETPAACRVSDAVLLGAVGGPRWDNRPLGQRPESGLLELRRELGLFVNLRPIQVRHSLREISPLRRARAARIDFEIVRELTGGIYFGAHQLGAHNGGEKASDTSEYTTEEIARVAHFAFGRAARRQGHLASVDKANVLATSVLWRKTVERMSAQFPEVRVDHLYVDNAAMQLVLRPEQFDVLVTENLFGDILSDEAAAIVGSIGLIPSMSLGADCALYEPIHGSAPSVAGKDSACPLGAIYCVSLMLRESFGLEREAAWIDSAVESVLGHGYRTPDIAEPGCQVVGCSALVNHILREMLESLHHAECYGWGV